MNPYVEYVCEARYGVGANYLNVMVGDGRKVARTDSGERAKVQDY